MAGWLRLCNVFNPSFSACQGIDQLPPAVAMCPVEMSATGDAELAEAKGHACMTDRACYGVFMSLDFCLAEPHGSDSHLALGD